MHKKVKSTNFGPIGVAYVKKKDVERGLGFLQTSRDYYEFLVYE